jgi:hypothetical protein
MLTIYENKKIYILILLVSFVFVGTGVLVGNFWVLIIGGLFSVAGIVLYMRPRVVATVCDGDLTIKLGS